MWFWKNAIALAAISYSQRQFNASYPALITRWRYSEQLLYVEHDFVLQVRSVRLTCQLTSRVSQIKKHYFMVFIQPAVLNKSPTESDKKWSRAQNAWMPLTVQKDIYRLGDPRATIKGERKREKKIRRRTLWNMGSL